jgi:hypothetical protein
MKYLDWSVQTLMILVAVMMVLLSHLPWARAVLMGLGAWQLLGCGVSLFVKSPFATIRRMYLFLAVPAAIALTATDLTGPDDLHRIGLAIAAMAIVFYYLITIATAFRTSRKGKFLPHINF